MAICQKIKDVESRLNRGLSARVRVGWLLRIRFVRQGQQSLVIWKRVVAVSHHYSHASAAKQFGTRLLPSYSADSSEATLDKAFHAMHSHITPRVWCANAIEPLRVVCWELADISPFPNLPPVTQLLRKPVPGVEWPVKVTAELSGSAIDAIRLARVATCADESLNTTVDGSLEGSVHSDPAVK